MELNYKLKVTQTNNTHLSKILKKTSDKLEINTFKFKGSLTLKSNSERISNYYIKTNNRVASIKKQGDTLVGFDYNTESLSLHYPEVSQEFLDDILDTDYRKSLYPVEHGKYSCNITSSDTVHLLFLDEVLNTFTTVPSTSYTLNLSNKTVEGAVLSSNVKLFLLVFKNEFEYVKTSNRLDLTPEFFINYPSGFYQVNPTFENKSAYSVTEISNDTLNLESNEVLNLKSELNLNFDNCITDKFKLLPTYPLRVSYSSNDYSPLNLIETFTTGYEYIIFKLEGEDFIPKFHLSLKNTSDVAALEEYNLLMQSHEEFKKPFYILCSQGNLDIIKDDLLLEARTIFNKDFDTILNNPSTNLSIKRIKLQ